jgi:replication factor A1
VKASDVKPGMRGVDLDLKIIEIEEPRSYISRAGREGRVTTAIGEDDSGRIKISLWDKDIDQVKVGSLIRIRNGYSRLFKDEVYVSAGMYGRLEVVE